MRKSKNSIGETSEEKKMEPELLLSY